MKSLIAAFAFSFAFAFSIAQSIPTVKEKTKSMIKMEGYFNTYYDQAKDQIFVEISALDTEFLYVNSLSAGVGSNDIGLDRGQLGADRVVKFQRIGPKVLMIQPNYSYRAISDNADERRAVEQAFAQSVIWGFKVVAEEGNSVLVDATDFIFRDAHGVINSLKRRNQGTYKLDKSRSAMFMNRTKSFPENTEFEVTLTFTGNATGGLIRSVTPSPNAVTVRQHHSFVKLPDSNYSPRKFDPRSGYFGISYFDYATPIDQPIVKRFINRHRLQKKDPTAAVSEAVEPIIYYLDRGAPEPIRSALLDGASWWNQAFEAAGYKDAFQVKLMPEGADPMDVRYNLIQWVHRSTRGWSYGSSVSDPRTGEIIKGHVSLGSLRVRQDFLIAVGLLAPYENQDTPPEMLELALARLRQLSAHEVGHTIGLSHNYSSSMDGRASVMDYPHPVVKLDAQGNMDLTDAYDAKIGDWDKAAVTYGYQDFPDGYSEEIGLAAILKETYDVKKLSFISDQDARPTGGAHPRAHLWDNGTDAADELTHVLKVRAAALANFSEKNVPIGAPLGTLEEALAPIYFFHRYQVEAAVKVVGGLDYTYAIRGDGQTPTSLINPNEQAKALASVLSTLSPANLKLSEDLIKAIPPRPLGYRRGRETVKIRTGITFDPLGAAESAADMSVGLLLHPARATRLVEYKSRDSKQPGLASVLDELINATVKSKRLNGMDGEIQRTVNGVVLNNLMQLSANNNGSDQARAIAYDRLVRLKGWLNSQLGSGDAWTANYRFLASQIGHFEADPGMIKKMEPLTPPDGSPIGSEFSCSFDQW